MIKKSKKRHAVCFACIFASVFTFTGCGSEAKNDRSDIHIEVYQMKTYNTTVVQKGDITGKINLTLIPDNYSADGYRVEGSYTAEEINVSVGDHVEAGDVMVSFEADEVHELIDTYTEQKEEDSLLIDHYTKLMEADPDTDYSEDIETLKQDMEIADLYIKEQTARLADYTLTAEKAGTVTYMNEVLSYGYVIPDTNLITVTSGSSDYITTTYDSYEFKIGDVYQAEFGIAVYDMKVKEVTKSVDEATGKDMQTILFEPLSDMSGVNESDELIMEFDKPTVHGVVYVNSDAVMEGDDIYYVYVISEDGYRIPVEVTPGEEVDDYTIIESGLSGGEQVTLN